jgi:hypothetical protein
MKNLLVFDFGGGTLDVTIMEIESGTMNFKARPLPLIAGVLGEAFASGGA